MQMLNWAIYSYNVNRPHTKSNESDTCDINNRTNGKSSTNDFISITDLVVPMSLSLLLSLIHSQIVATSSANLSVSDKLSKGPVQQHRKKRERKKRRKSTRPRSALNNETKSRTNSLADEKEAIEPNIKMCRRLSSQLQQQQQQSQTQQQQRDQQPQQQQPQQNDADESNCSPQRLRKRNVNWCSPIKSNHNARIVQFDIETSPNQDTDNHNEHETIGGDDDGFESLNGKSSSGEEMSTINNSQAIELNAENESTIRNSQQYAIGLRAYLRGTSDEYDIKNYSDNDLSRSMDQRIKGTNGISENVSYLMILSRKLGRDSRLHQMI